MFSIWMQVQMTVALNSWYGKFYDLLQNSADYVDKPQEGIALFYQQLVSIDYVRNGFEGDLSFLVIASPYVRIALEASHDLGLHPEMEKC